MKLSLIEIKPGEWIVPDHIDAIRELPREADEQQVAWTEVRLESGYVVTLHEPAEKVIERIRLLVAHSR